MDFSEIAKQYTRQEFIDLLEKNEYGEKSLILKDDNGCFVYCPSHLGLKTVIDCKVGMDTCSICWLNAIKDIKFKDEIQEDDKIKSSKINNVRINEELWNEFMKGNIVISIKRSEIPNFLKKCLKLGLKYTHFYTSMWAVTIEDMLKQDYIVDDEIFYYEVYIGHKEHENKNPLLTCFDNKKSNDKKVIEYSKLFIEDKKYSASEIIHMIEEDKLNKNDIIIDKDNVKYDFSDIQKEWTLEEIIEFAPYKIEKYESKYITFDEAVKSGKNFRYRTWDTSVNNVTDAINQLLINPRKNIIQVLKEKVWLIEE